MENQTNEFKEEIQFDNPLQNETFLHYLIHNNVPCDFNRLYNDPSYAQALYVEYFEHLIFECLRPEYPPIINVEEYVNENEKNKKIKDMSKMNKGNGFMVYRKNLNKHLEMLGERITMQQLSPLAGSLWKSEPKQVKDHYKDLSEEIKKLHNNRVENCIKNNHKRSSEDNYDYENMSSKKFKEMTTKNGGNAFIIFRKQLNEELRSSGYNLNMQDHSKFASYYWSIQPKEVKGYFKALSGQFKKTLNDQLKQMFCKSDNDNNEPIIDNDSLNYIKLDNNNGSTMSYIKPDNDDNGLIMNIKPDNDASANDAHDSCWMGELKPFGSLINDFNNYLKSDMGPDSCRMGELKSFGSLTNDFNNYLKSDMGPDSCWMGELKPFGSLTNDFNNFLKLGPESIVENSIEENFFLAQY
ncbi:unnamed protein product [Rhizophagus irregularis]|uniref:HMG box domain-containing protein n=2 Tax=Rhizophagus irregularis TaxID=588596 RepID=A0A2I1G9I6_9GLOM|nr:hypothetical protein RhiirA4_509257 [Rhizophagus irregularis]CAB4428759.1 unnamed protein product [Rhizophagus irregularis]